MASVNAATVEDLDLSYTPPTPFHVSLQSVMSQDVVATTRILVDSTSPAPVAPFVNPSTSETEALVISKVGDGGQSQICHVARDRGTDGGWALEPLFGGTSAAEVAAGTAYPGTGSAALYGFYRTSSGLNVTQLGADGSTWGTPQSISGGDGSHLRVAYSPGGRLVLYGSDGNGDLVTAYQTGIGGSFSATVCSMDGALSGGDFQLCLTDETTWTVAANVDGKPYLFTGQLGATEYSGKEVTKFTGTLEQIVLGYWSDEQNTLMYLFVDDDHALHVWSSNDANPAPVVQPIPNSTVVGATGHVGADGSLNIYSIDDAQGDEQGLWVLHQSSRNPWNDDGTPNWAPYIAIDKGVKAVVGDANPADAPALFALDAGDFSLRFHAQDPLTSMWMSGTVLQSAVEAFEVVRFRTEINLTDDNGNPVQQPVTVSVAEGDSATEIWVAGTIYPVDSQTEVQLTTDVAGKVTIAVHATAGMATPALVLNTAGLAQSVTFRPCEPVHTYLSGQGTLNPTSPNGPLPVFDAAGTTLKGAKVDGKSLAPKAKGALAGTAAAAIRNTALVGLGTPPVGIAGYAGSLNEANGAEFTVFRTPEELQAHLTLLHGGAEDEPEGFGDELSDFFGDVWEGIKNGAIKIWHFAVDVADKVAHFVAQIGKEIARGVKLGLKGLEQAASFISGVFAALAAEIEKVIDWLKALFDFGAIWRTKMALEEALLAAPAYVTKATDLGKQLADNWFTTQKAQVDKAFAALEQQYSGQTFGGQKNWQQPGSGPSTQPIAGSASPSDFTNNVHHNWLQDKVSSYTPADSGIKADLVDDSWDDFAKLVHESAEDFLAACSDFCKGFEDTVTNPTKFSSLGLQDFLKAANELIDALLTLCDAIVAAFAAIVESAMDSLGTLLTTELQLGFLNSLWAWLAKTAGYPDDSKLTMAALMSLLPAFPATVIYKLIEGVANEPFPSGKFPTGHELEAMGNASPLAVVMPYACRLISAIMQLVYLIPAMISDTLGNKSPKVLTAISIGFSAGIWVLANGYPDLTPNEWLNGSLLLIFVCGMALWVVMYFKVVQDNIADIADVLISVIGVGKLIVTIVAIVEGAVANAEDAIAKVLLTLPSIFGFLNMSTFRDDPESAAGAIAANLIFDFVGYVGGGAIEMIEVVNSPRR